MFQFKKWRSYAFCHRKESEFEGPRQKLCKRWWLMLLWDFSIVYSASTGMKHGWLLLILWEKCLKEEYVSYNTRFDDCIPVIKFKEKIFFEKLYNIRGNVCVKFQLNTVTDYAEITQNILKLWLCGTPKVGVSPLPPWHIMYIMSISICIQNRMLISTSECEMLSLKIMELYECRHYKCWWPMLM